MKKQNVLFCWSGGKDSAMALYEIINSGSHKISALLITFTEDYERISMHDIRTALLDREISVIL